MIRSIKIDPSCGLGETSSLLEDLASPR